MLAIRELAEHDRDPDRLAKEFQLRQNCGRVDKPKGPTNVDFISNSRAVDLIGRKRGYICKFFDGCGERKGLALSLLQLACPKRADKWRAGCKSINRAIFRLRLVSRTCLL